MSFQCQRHGTRTGSNTMSRSTTYLHEDIHHLASNARYPKLENCHELAEDLAVQSKKKRQNEVLQQCLLLQLERHVVHAQRQGTVPPADELAKLPLFQEARNIDALHLRERYETTCLRKKEEERRRLEEERVEAERKLEREELRRKKMAMKEKRRQERISVKKEQAIALYEKKKLQFEEAWGKWQDRVKEQQDALDALQEKIRALDERKKGSEDSIKLLEKERECLLESLREAAARTDGSHAVRNDEHVGAGQEQHAPPGTSRFRHTGNESTYDSSNRNILKSSGSREYRSHPPPPPRRHDDHPRGHHTSARHETSSIRRGPPVSARYDRSLPYGSDQRESGSLRSKPYKGSHGEGDRYYGSYQRHDRQYSRQY